MKIIVTGSLGNISQPLAQQLIAQGHEVTIISSKAEKRPEIEALGAKAAIGLVEDTGFLTSAFAGADAVYAMTPPNFGTPDPIAYYRRVAAAYAQAVKNTGVKHLVYLSSYGAELKAGSGLIMGSHYSEAILNELTGSRVTMLRPGYFYYNLYNFLGMIRQQGIMGSNFGGDDKLFMVSPLDIATAAAEELNDQTAGNKVRYIFSDEHTCTEVARILGNAIGKPDLQWLTFTDQQVASAMEEHAIPPATAALLVELGAAIHTGMLRLDDRYKPEPGKTKLQDFVPEFVAAYNGMR